MTEEEQRQEAIRFETQARRDLQDIRALKEFLPFQRYFMRRLVQKRDEIAGAFYEAEPFVVKKDPHGIEHRVEVCSKEEREILRRILREMNALVNLTTEDAGNARVQVDRMAG